MSDEKISVKFDFDSKEALGKIDELNKTLSEIGEVESFGKLIGTMKSFLGPIALVTAAVFALKEAFDLALEGEQIKQIEKQFDNLSKSVGIVGDELKESIEKAKGPTVDLTDALKASNEAIVKLGLSANRIPEIMELSRKTTKVFGGDFLENFDKMSMALANGNVRMLKLYGLNIDADEALKKYARTVGTTVNSLTEFQKQQAIINEVLSVGKEKYKGISTDTDLLADKVKSLGVAWNEMKEAFALLVSKVSPMIAPIIEQFSEGLNIYARWIGSIGKEDANKISDKLAELREEKKKLQDEMRNALLNEKDTSDIHARIKKIVDEIEAAEAKLGKLKPAEHAAESKEAEGVSEAEAERNKLLAAERKKQRDRETVEENKFQLTLLQLKQKNAEDSMKFMTDEFDARMRMYEQEVLAEQEYNERIKQIEIQRDIEGSITRKRAQELILELENEKLMKLQSMAEKEKDLDTMVAENKVRLAQDTKSKIYASLDESGLKLKKEMNEWGARAVIAKGIMANNFASGFKAIGDGSKSAGQAMGDAMAGAIGDMAENQGQLMLAAGLWPFNPLVLAGGAALMVLAGALKGRGGGGSVSTGGGGSGSISSGTIANPSIPPEVAQEKKKSVSIQVLGNYFETQETSRRLMELIRAESDATDFKYQQIGVR